MNTKYNELNEYSNVREALKENQIDESVLD